MTTERSTPAPPSTTDVVSRAEHLAMPGASPDSFAQEFRRLNGGLYIRRGATLTAHERILYAVKGSRDNPVVGGTAATILHGTAWFNTDFAVTLYRDPTAGNKSVRGSSVHRTAVKAEDITDIGGIRVTNVVRTAFDIGRSGPEWRCLGYLDALQRATGFDVNLLAAYTAQQSRRRGIRTLRKLIPLIDGASESPPESWLRLLMFNGRLPAPQLQIEVSDNFGNVYARIDIGYEEAKIAIEFDGYDYHSTDRQLAHDARRDAMLRDDGWIIIRVDAAQLRTQPGSIVAAIIGALNSRGAYF